MSEGLDLKPLPPELLKGFVSALLDDMPPQVLATVIIRVCEEFAYEAPQVTKNILANNWAILSPVLCKYLDATKEKLSAKIPAAMLIIEGYFRHSGNWALMRKGLLEDVANVDPELARKTADRLYNAMADKIRQDLKEEQHKR